MSLAATLAVLALLVGLGVLAWRLSGRLRREEDSWRVERLRRPAYSGEARTDPEMLQKRVRRLVRVLGVLGLPIAVLTEGRQGIGERVVGLRLADARTGGRISRRQAVVRIGALRAWQWATGRLTPAPKVHSNREHYLLNQRVEAARRAHPDDAEARQKALAEIFASERVAPGKTMLPILLRLALNVLPQLPVFSARNQSIPDILAGTVVLRGRPSAGGSTRSPRAAWSALSALLRR